MKLIKEETSSFEDKDKIVGLILEKDNGSWFVLPLLPETFSKFISKLKKDFLNK